MDVSGMTPPFLLRAEGTFQGRSVVIHSVAGQADIGGTINITPLTDLILSNASGQLAEAFFDGYVPETHAPLLTPALLASAREALEARFAVMVDSLGLEGEVDLLRTPFDADHTGLDALLDVLELRLKTDAEGNPTTIYQIVNVVTGEVLEDDLTDPADVGAFTEAGSLEEGALAASAILELFGSYEAVFEGALPSAENGKLGTLEALVADTYQDAGKDKATWVSDQAGEVHRVDMAIEELSIKSMDLAATPRTAEVFCKIRQGHYLARERFTLAEEDGSWKFYGNQKAYHAGVVALSKYELYDDSFSGGMLFYIEGNTTEIFKATVSGPGIVEGPDTVLTDSRQWLYGYPLAYEKLVATDDPLFSDGAEYTLTLSMNDGSTEIETIILEKAPLSQDYVLGRRDDFFVGPTAPELSYNMYDGGDIRFAWTQPSRTQFESVNMIVGIDSYSETFKDIVYSPRYSSNPEWVKSPFTITGSFCADAHWLFSDSEGRLYLTYGFALWGDCGP
ncbi:hypothetical protein [Desulfoluna limicola]|uniref:hypothetical protein n=1 Tax=Desulfoluna limicola TaxID=2810562 RepID=UPI001F46622F|nr:hypothetical protein [Desulfoluna limicola]